MKLREDLEPLSPSVIDRLKNRGMSQSEIARMYDVTRQYISWIKYYHGGALTRVSRCCSISRSLCRPS
jgi:transcriptional regulator